MMPTSKSSIDKRDVYYRKGKAAGYRARSAYKLLHLDEELNLFDGVQTAVDLCAAPGSWSQVLAQKLKPGRGDDDTRVVSVDLQPMAPLPNIAILQTDITLPSTIPMVLDALGGRKADLVVCDGAPDVTGVHDLDAYLHSQLLLAALTLSLTLLAPGATLIFKIFLSPLDPQASMLRSQLQPFFSQPLAHSENADAFQEFDDNTPMDAVDGQRDLSAKAAGPSIAAPGFDALGRRGGVWVRKPRSSRQGSGEAFIVCRNFDPAVLPFPPIFTSSALDSLRQDDRGTLTLESLAGLLSTTGSTPKSDAWETLRAYAGSGDLSESRFIKSRLESTLGDAVPTSSSTMMNGKVFPKSTHASPASPVSHMRIDIMPPSATFNTSSSNPARRAIENARRTSISSLTPPLSSSPTSATFAFDKPWDRNGPSPLPSPISLQPTGGGEGLLSLAAEQMLANGAHGDGNVSPALSTSSKTDLFFGSSAVDMLPTPPKPLSSLQNGIGKGLPSAFVPASTSRSVSTPSRSVGVPPASPRTDAFFASHQRGSSTSSTISPAKLNTSRIISGQIPLEPLATLPTDPRLARSPSVPHKGPRRESQQLEREQKHLEASEPSTLEEGDVLVPVKEDAAEGNAEARTWKLGKRLGEGAFSSVWSASASDSSPASLTAVKLLSRSAFTSNSRTRISFVREVEVLRHISHPSIVSYITSFSTVSYHCLLLERLEGGELFELVSDHHNRDRMLLPSEADPEGEGFIRRLFGELCTAVNWLHEVHVVHRDIKLENILLTVNPFTIPPTSGKAIPIDRLPSPLVKLTDFGLSRFISPISPMLTTRCGSESFAAPEIIMGTSYDGRDTDSWAVGVVLYTLVVGELPFERLQDADGSGDEHRERRRKMMRIAKADYAWPVGVGSAGVREVVGKLLVRSTEKRWRVKRMWELPWMRGPGSVDDPHVDKLYCSNHTDLGGEMCTSCPGKKRVLDGFLVDGEGIQDVASAEEVR